jgi:hypothetical protein
MLPKAVWKEELGAGIVGVSDILPMINYPVEKGVK